METVKKTWDKQTLWVRRTTLGGEGEGIVLDEAKFWILMMVCMQGYKWWWLSTGWMGDIDDGNIVLQNRWW